MLDLNSLGVSSVAALPSTGRSRDASTHRAWKYQPVRADHTS
jgi:hypothetical protein